jgi:hypothetical protein
MAATGRPLAWTPRRRAVDAFEDVELAVRAPEGYASARVVVHALAESADGGSVDVDDVSLVERASEGSVLEQGGFRLALLGAPATGAVLVRSGGVLASEIGLEQDEASRAAAQPLACTSEANGFRIALPAGALLRMRLEPLALRSGCATLGSEGYSARSADFESEAVGTVLVGRDLDLFGLRCEPPLAVSARTVDGAMLLAFRASEEASVLVQTDFQAERSRAHELARTADEAERAGRIGPCLAALGELLDRVPVQSELVAKAEATRARLTRDGLAAVGALRAEFERARFFRLIDLFESLRARNQELAARYEGSDVVGEITALGADIDAELASLLARRDAHERERLRAILAGLRAGDAGDLARAVETYLAEHFGSDALPPEEPPER